MKKAMIIGGCGQDGAYLSKFLIDKGYEVFVTTRNVNSANVNGLRRLGVEDKINKVSLNPSNYSQVFECISSIMPDEIYNLSGQSSVSLSFTKAIETYESIAIALLNILEACKKISKSIKLYNAGSGEMFGTRDSPANESSKIKPLSPYGVAKASSNLLVQNYRKAYGTHICNGILFNHESALRPINFVTQKIIYSAKGIHSGEIDNFSLGNINIYRDWGWAPEYVEAMWLMLQLDQPEDFVIATGKSHSLEYFVECAFKYFNLNYKDYLVEDKDLLRPSDIVMSCGNPQKAKNILGWKSSVDIEELIEKMLNDHL